MRSVFSQSSDQAADSNDKAIDNEIKLVKARITDDEKKLWSNPPSLKDISSYQDSFKQLEHLYSEKSHDERYSFKIVIPVADRPQHLKQYLL